MKKNPKSFAPYERITLKEFFPNRRSLFLIGASLVLAGCQSEALQPVSLPTAAVLPQHDTTASRESVRSRSVTSADGRTVRTTTTSTGISINLDALADARSGTPQSPEARRNAYLVF